MEEKETVTICFLTNHEVDPDEVDLRFRDPAKVREQLIQAAEPCGSIQVLADTTDEGAEMYRKEVIEARRGNQQRHDA